MADTKVIAAKIEEEARKFLVAHCENFTESDFMLIQSAMMTGANIALLNQVEELHAENVRMAEDFKR